MGINYRKQEDALFDDWQKDREPFIRDGVVNPNLFTDLKIVYILKEANDPESKEGWDLREFLINGGRPQTWDNIALWTYGIMNIYKDFSWKYLSKKLRDPDFRKNMLNKICALNIKKKPGGHTSDNSIIVKYGEEHGEELTRQYEIYSDCELFICCGTPTGDIFLKNILGRNDSEWNKTRRGIWYMKLEEDKHLVYYYHPEARIDDNLLYYGLIDGVKEIIIK